MTREAIINHTNSLVRLAGTRNTPDGLRRLNAMKKQNLLNEYLRLLTALEELQDMVNHAIEYEIGVQLRQADRNMERYKRLYLEEHLKVSQLMRRRKKKKRAQGRPPSYDKRMIVKVIRLHKHKLSTRVISKRVGLSPSTVCRMIHKFAEQD